MQHAVLEVAFFFSGVLLSVIGFRVYGFTVSAQGLRFDVKDVVGVLSVQLYTG